MLETPAGQAYHLPLDARSAADLRVGDIVSVTAARTGHRLLVRRRGLPLDRQVDHPGPVWLDDVRGDTLAPYGFGRQVREALARRVEYLRRLDITPEDPSRLTKLRELEDRAVGRGVAARTGQVFLPRVPNGFRGRVQGADVGTASEAHVIISDGLRFVVLRDAPPVRQAIGRQVVLTLDQSGQVFVALSPERDRGG